MLGLAPYVNSRVKICKRETICNAKIEHPVSSNIIFVCKKLFKQEIIMFHKLFFSMYLRHRVFNYSFLEKGIHVSHIHQSLK